MILHHYFSQKNIICKSNASFINDDDFTAPQVPRTFRIRDTNSVSKGGSVLTLRLANLTESGIIFASDSDEEVYLVESRNRNISDAPK